VLSFVLLGIYWNNHHHMLQATDRINGATLWANLHLLFWLSLIPFVTSWMGDNHHAAVPTAIYGVCFCAAGSRSRFSCARSSPRKAARTRDSWPR